MKRFTVLLICLCVCFCFSLTAFADDSTKSEGAVIHVTVPETHMITVTLPDDMDCKINGKTGEVKNGNMIFEVSRMSDLLIEFVYDESSMPFAVTLNGEDITDKLTAGKFQMMNAHEDLTIKVTEKKDGITDNDSTSSETEQSSRQETTSSGSKSSSSSNKNTGKGSPDTGVNVPIQAVSCLILATFVMILFRRKKCR